MTKLDHFKQLVNLISRFLVPPVLKFGLSVTKSISKFKNFE